MRRACMRRRWCMLITACCTYSQHTIQRRVVNTAEGVAGAGWARRWAPLERCQVHGQLHASRLLDAHSKFPLVRAFVPAADVQHVNEAQCRLLHCQLKRGIILTILQAWALC